jgi:hypothetical protein
MPRVPVYGASVARAMPSSNDSSKRCLRVIGECLVWKGRGGRFGQRGWRCAIASRQEVEACLAVVPAGSKAAEPTTDAAGLYWNACAHIRIRH